VILCLQDTTELNFKAQDIAGLGSSSYAAQRGMYAHPTCAVSLSREPLGVLDAWMWAREPKDERGERDGIWESLRWTEGYQRIAGYAEELPDTRMVYVADRESDLLELMETAYDWAIRRIGSFARNITAIYRTVTSYGVT
jgi:hypothetical protein